MNLDIKFVFFGFIIIFALIPLYIYRKEIYKRFAKKGNIKIFVKELDAYLSYHHPRINFEFSILERIDKDEDYRTNQILIVEDMVRQFAYYEYELSTQTGIAKSKLWSGYEQGSLLQKDNKLPNDWSKRKEAAWSRDGGKCNRCGTKIDVADANALLAKQMKNGGGFNLENIVILCNDCARVIKSSNIDKTRKDLNILDNLMRRVSN